MNNVSIRGFPLPPSANNVYANSRTGGRFKTASYKAYVQSVQWWAVQNAYQLSSLRDWFQSAPFRHAIRIDHMFLMRHDKIITKDFRPRRNDTFNRIKVLHDVLAEMLGIDDSYFWSGFVDKQPISADGLSEGVDLYFSFVDLSVSRSIINVESEAN